MTQHLLIKPEVASTVIKPVSANKALSSDKQEIQPFSSELNKQIDKHAGTQGKGSEQAEQLNKKQTTKQQNDNPKAEKVEDDNGKNLPEEANTDSGYVDAEQMDDIVIESESADETVILVNTSTTVATTVSNTDDVTKITETESKTSKKILVNNLPTEATKQPVINPQDKASSVAIAKTASVDLPEANNKSTVKQVLLATHKNSEATSNKTASETAIVKPGVSTHIKEEVGSADDKVGKKKPVAVVEQKMIQSQQVASQEKLVNVVKNEVITPVKEVSQNMVEGLSSDQKKQATALRPDILYGINKKYSAKANKVDVKAVTEKVMTSEQIATKVMSESKLLTEVAKQVKPGLQHTGATTERGHALGGLVSTPAATVSQGQAVTTATTPTLDIQPALQSAAWTRVMSGRVVYMAREGIQQAELKLNPAKLGPVEVRLNMNNDQTSVTFIANHAATREALEQALPRLRESFSENGMELTDAEVTQHSEEQEHQDDATETDGSGTLLSGQDSEEHSGEQQPNNNEQEELDVGLSLYA